MPILQSRLINVIDAGIRIRDALQNINQVLTSLDKSDPQAALDQLEATIIMAWETTARPYYFLEKERIHCNMTKKRNEYERRWRYRQRHGLEEFNNNQLSQEIRRAIADPELITPDQQQMIDEVNQYDNPDELVFTQPIPPEPDWASVRAEMVKLGWDQDRINENLRAQKQTHAALVRQAKFGGTNGIR